MLAAEIEAAKRRAQIEAWDAGEKAIAESLGDLLTPPELAPGDVELIKPWLAWCRDKSIRHAPAKSWCVAAFVIDRHKQGDTEQHIVDTLSAVTRLHSKFQLADPVTGPVHAVFYRLYEIKAPRSWPKEDKALFATLPALIRLRIQTREQQRDNALRLRMDQIAELKKQLITQPDEAKPVATEKELTDEQVPQG